MAVTISENILNARKANLRDCFIDCDHLKHRNEVVETRNGVNYIDDSGARSVSATYFTLSDMTEPTVWITIGGNEDYEELIPVVRQCVTSIICIGEFSDNINKTFGSVVRGGVKNAADMTEAMTMVEDVVTSGQNVIFSPATKNVGLDSTLLASEFVVLSKNN